MITLPSVFIFHEIPLSINQGVEYRLFLHSTDYLLQHIVFPLVLNDNVCKAA